MAAEVRVLAPDRLPFLGPDAGDDGAGFDGEGREGGAEGGVGAG